jgi:hypothetical protein
MKSLNLIVYLQHLVNPTIPYCRADGARGEAGSTNMDHSSTGAPHEGVFRFEQRE